MRPGAAGVLCGLRRDDDYHIYIYVYVSISISISNMEAHRHRGPYVEDGSLLRAPCPLPC